MNKQKISKIAAATLLGLSISAPLVAQTTTTILNPRTYAIQVYYGHNLGGQITANNGREDLQMPLYSVDEHPSINKEMWAVLDQYQPDAGECWIEAGSKVGTVFQDLSESVDSPENTIHWEGHFIGYQTYHNLPNASTGYYEFHSTPYSNYRPTGAATYQIRATNPSIGEWKVFVNGYQALTMNNVRCRNPSNATPYKADRATRIHAGIENKEAGNTFTRGTYMSTFNILGMDGTTWTRAKPYALNGFVYSGVKTEDRGNQGWTSKFTYNPTYNTNRIDFYRP